uniref:Uncharacterized protein n=1 Tax=Pipistrellus kuhlii TaxID=59472 RepID=A0A7J7RD77_PIPKU|nr:hypothetical protein mPipKuh1_010682 [Pipistrellus kuhlii]
MFPLTPRLSDGGGALPGKPNGSPGASPLPEPLSHPNIEQPRSQACGPAPARKELSPGQAGSGGTCLGSNPSTVLGEACQERSGHHTERLDPPTPTWGAVGAGADVLEGPAPPPAAGPERPPWASQLTESLPGRLLPRGPASSHSSLCVSAERNGHGCWESPPPPPTQPLRVSAQDRVPRQPPLRGRARLTHLSGHGVALVHQPPQRPQGLSCGLRDKEREGRRWGQLRALALVAGSTEP